MAPSKQPQRAEDEILDWFTISYSTLYAALGIVLLLAGGGAYWFYLRGNTPEVVVETPAPTVTTARFTSLEGSVKVKAVGKFEWDGADRNVVLRKNDLVRTGPGSTAEITFFDGTVVHVRPDSLITIEETSQDPSTKASKVAWHISSGEVNFQTVRQNVPGSETKVSTPTVQGTVNELSNGGVRVAESGDSDFRLFQGSGKVTTKTGETIQLGASEAIKVDAAGKASPKVALLAAPTLLTPPHQAEITYPNPSLATTLLLWKGPSEAISYHLMLDYSAYFNRPLVDRKGIKDAQQELRGLEVGKYYWRVAAIDKNGEEGAFSDFARFTVAGPGGGTIGDGPPPPLLIESIDTRQNILQVKGKTEPGASVTVNGQRVEVEGDGSFNDFITLEKPGRQVVVIRATGLNGGVNEQRRPVVVGY
jgi:hypothetical protein